MNDEPEKVILVSKYNYYKYYDMRKHIYRLNYQEKKQREAENKVDKNYYYDYWKNCKWKN
jgi:hypothetical protein